MKSLLPFLIIFFLVPGVYTQVVSFDTILAKEKPFQISDTSFVSRLTTEAYRIYDIDLEKTKAYADKAYLMSTELNYAKGICESSRLIGIFHHKKANYDSAMFYYEKSFSVASTHNLKPAIASALNNIALLLYFNGNYPLALEKYYKCIEIREELGETQKLATPINNIALIYSQQDKPQKALEYFFKSLDIEQQIGDSSRLGLTYMNIATEYAALDSVEQALKYFNKSIGVCKRNNNQLTLTYVYSRIAELYDNRQEFIKSKKFHFDGLSIAYKLGTKYEIANALSGIAHHYYLIEEYKTAVKYADSAKTMALKLKIPAVAENATMVLYKSYAKLNKFEKAFENLSLNRQLSDSLKNEKNTQLVYEFEYEKKLKDNQIEKAQKEAQLVREKLINTLLTSFLAIGLGIIVFLSVRNREKKKTNMILSTQKEELNSYKDHLEDMVKERTDDLKLALDKANESSMLKTEFLHNISHEVRTPMNGIIGFSTMLNNDNLKPERRSEYVKTIKSSSLQLLKIIDDIIEISSFETNQIKRNNHAFCLNELIQEVYSIFSLKSKERNIPIHIKKGLDDNKSKIVTDKVKLTKILNNLVENALTYTVKGFIEVGYYLENTSLILYVKDTGVGIAPENMQLIFERFSQEEKELSKKQGGLGLGLSISKENALLLDGNITVESEKGKGSTFYVTIPYVQANAKSSPST